MLKYWVEILKYWVKILKYWVGVQWGQPYLWGGAFLDLVGHPSSDGITINIPYGVDVL